MSTTLGTRTTAIPQATSQPLVLVGRTLVAFGLIGIGVTHFVFGDFMLGRAPPWPEGVPGKGLWTGASGTAVILAGIAILMGRRVRAVALFIAALVAVWALARNLPVLFITRHSPDRGHDWARPGRCSVARSPWPQRRHRSNTATPACGGSSMRPTDSRPPHACCSVSSCC